MSIGPVYLKILNSPILQIIVRNTKVKSLKSYDSSLILVPIFGRINHRHLCTTRSNFILRKEPKPNPFFPNEKNIRYYMAIGLIPTFCLFLLCPYWILDYYGFVPRDNWIHEKLSITLDFTYVNSLFWPEQDISKNRLGPEKNSNKEEDSKQSEGN